MRRQTIEEVVSTNTYLREHPEAVAPMTMLCAVRQTAGRGQRGNSWESEPGRNLTFSFHFRPEGVRPSWQFAISEAVALGVADALAAFGIGAKVKWPNDIYVGDRKIAGILIEHTICGMEISRTIAGVGLNVNQTEFVSDAPNPVSMAMLCGREFSLDSVADAVGEALSRRLDRTRDEAGRGSLHSEFLGRLWRGDGRMYPFAEPGGEPFMARIAGVGPDGILLLSLADGGERRYAFKEVGFLKIKD